MANIYLYAHGGSGNHGCEAIVRATAKLLPEHALTLISSNPDEDNQYHVSALCRVVRDWEENLERFSPDFLAAYAKLKLKKDFIPLEKLHYKKAFSMIQKGDYAFSIGGDNYCYADVYKYVMFHEMAKSRGAKTVLWGCSVEPKLLEQPHIAADLTRYDYITARETISYEALRKINPNTILVSDPAFSLDKTEMPLPKEFISGNTVGINLSPMVIGKETVPGMAYLNYVALIEHILENTDMNVALIPHVVWKDGDDRKVMQPLYDQFAATGRICMIDDHNCEELKGYISRCRFFVGARTHATIAAYSTCVPTLVVGYSVKARGIARDLFGTEEGYVLPVQDLRKKNDLLTAFERIRAAELSIKMHLSETMPQYREKALGISLL